MQVISCCGISDNSMNNSIMASTTVCIYCGESVSLARGQGDHVIPVQLGKFRGDVLFKHICRACNSKIGKSEQQLLQCGPESFFRAIVRPNVPSKRKRGSSQSKGAAGAPSPEHTFDPGDHRRLVKPPEGNSEHVQPIDQVIIHDEHGNEYFIRLFQGMRPEQLQKRINKNHIRRMHKLWFECTQALWPEYKELIKSVYPGADIEELDSIEKGVHWGKWGATFKVNEHYYRALAKIAFHYYLTHSRRRFWGHEDCFSPLRSFIMGGGNRDQFFCKPSPKFFMPFGHLIGGGTMTPNRWRHIFIVEESKDPLGVYMQFFVGQGCIPQSHYVTLAVSTSHIEVPSFVFGHAYVYDYPQRPVHCAGQVEELQITRASSRLFSGPQDGWRENLL